MEVEYDYELERHEPSPVKMEETPEESEDEEDMIGKLATQHPESSNRKIPLLG